MTSAFASPEPVQRGTKNLNRRVTWRGRPYQISGSAPCQTASEADFSVYGLGSFYEWTSAEAREH